MSNERRSTVILRSNLYPVRTGRVVSDKDFLAAINDPKALHRLRAYGPRGDQYLNKLQQRQEDKGQHCTPALDDDYPWGTVIIDGVQKVVCKCTNYRCPEFHKCRPDFVSPDDDPIHFYGLPEEQQNEVAAAAPTLAQDSRESEDGQATNTQAPISPTIHEQTFEEGLRSLATQPRKGLIDSGGTAATPEAATNQAPEVTPQPSTHAGEAQTQKAPAAEAMTPETATPKPQEVPVANVPRPALDPEQRRVVTASASKRLYVNAGPGTGKTHTLIERIKYLLNVEHVSPSSILVMSYTNAAVSVVQSRLCAAALAGEIDAVWQDVDVLTFDKWCTRLLVWAKGETPNEVKGPLGTYDERISKAAFYLGRHPGIVSSCSHLFVDETQDLVGPRARLTLNLIKAVPENCGITLLGDRCQSLYDYEADRKHFIDSEGFYDHLRENWTFTELLLERDHRMEGKKRQVDLTALRGCLLSRDADSAAAEVGSLVNALPQPDCPLQRMEENELSQPECLGTFAILTRSNVEAMTIGARLHRKGIAHVVSRTLREHHPTRLLADILLSAGHDTIDEADFIQQAARYGVGEDRAFGMWMDLASLSRSTVEGTRRHVGDILKDVYESVLPPTLVARPDAGAKVFVGTIHSAKGREFDTVWLLKEDLEGISEKPDLNEAKVAYVAMSRTRSQMGLQTLHDANGEQGNSRWSSLNDNSRCYEARTMRTARRSRGKKRRLTRMELLNGSGCEQCDVDYASLGASAETQRSLRDGDLGGEDISNLPLRLRLLPNTAEDSLPGYGIYADDQSILLGTTSYKFVEAYRACYREVRKGEDDPPLPDEFDDIYLDQVISCIAPTSKAPAGARTFQSSVDGQTYAIWYGFTIGGFPQVNDSQSY